MMTLLFPLRSGGNITLQIDSADMNEWMTAMGKLTGCMISSAAESEASCHICVGERKNDPRFIELFSAKIRRLFFLPEDQSFHECINPEYWEDWKKAIDTQSYTGRLAVIGGVLREMLRGKPICLIHGALLHSEKGNCLLCGESGIGKSTTSRRWCEAGGTAPADDMSLLEFCKDGVWIHPLPTWSLCARKGMDELHYPFNPPLSLDRLIILGRAPEKETLQEVEPWKFLQGIYSACMLFPCYMPAKMPLDIQQRLMRQIQGRTLELVQKYPPMALLAHLDGNLAETLSEYL